MSYPTLVEATEPQPVTITSEIPDSFTPGQQFQLTPANLVEVNAAGDETAVPLGHSGPFVVTVGAEEILVGFITPQGLASVYVYGGANGRGWNSTTPAEHAAGASATISDTSAQENAGGGGGGLPPQAGTSPQNPTWLDPLQWALLSFAPLSMAIDPFTYFNGPGDDGLGATVTQSTPSDGALTIDGGTPSVGDRVLFSSDSDSDPDFLAPGIYVVTALGDGATVPWVLTRSQDANTPDALYTFWAATIAAGNYFGGGEAAVYASNNGPIGNGGFVAWNLAAENAVALGGGATAVSGIAIDGATSTEGLIAVGGTASGSNAVAIGEGAVASGPTSIALGTNATASGTSAVSFGEDSVAAGDYSTVLGIGSQAPADGGIASGVNALAWAPWLWALSCGAFAVLGGSQYDFWIPYNKTTDATPTQLGSATNSISLGFPEQMSLTPPDFIRTMLLEFRIVARRTDAPGEASVWECNNFVIDGDGSGAYRVVGTPTVTVVQQDAAVATDGWDATPELTEDNTGVQVTVTGAAGQTIQWTCTMKIYEVAG